VEAQRAFAANASHQLRTPLTGMKLQLEAALDAPASADVRSHLEAADREVDRLSTVVTRLLTLSRSVDRTDLVAVDVADAATRAAERWRREVEGGGRSLFVEARPGCAAAGPIELDQILDNLIENAITHGRGAVRVGSGARDGLTFVAVGDEGPGIPTEEAGRVTERFYRGRGATPGGSGLGLAIVRELAEGWGGNVEIEPGPGQGTRVEVRLRPANPRGKPSEPLSG
jgi:two-component system OmpR family sensor kinase